MDLRRFTERKADHLKLALHPANDAEGQTDLDRVRLIHEALPECDFSEINPQSSFWGHSAATPFFISSMTAGHEGGEALNLRLARVAEAKSWPMGLGSQRRELSDGEAAGEWKKLRAAAPRALLFSNLGLSQLIETPLPKVLTLIENLQAGALIIHLNPLQESLQPEGTPRFKGGLLALENLTKISPVPVIVKETGCGISASTAKKLLSTGIQAIDVAGFGGTHWGRIEGARAESQGLSLQAKAALAFKDWGLSTADSLIAVKGVLSEAKQNLELWASGGIRNGVDAAKCLALGAHKVGFAKAALVAALEGDESLARWMEQMEFELRVALFNTGSKTVAELQGRKVWQKV